jgi:hypothetical protein
MKKTLSRSIIHPEIQWHQFDQNLNEIILSHQDIIEAIDFWKIILGEHGFGKNKKLGPVLSLCDIKYLSLLFATLELGGVLCVMDKPNTPDRVQEIRSRVFSPIDIIVTSPTPTDIENAVADAFGEKQIYSDLWHEYVATNFSFKDLTGTITQFGSLPSGWSFASSSTLGLFTMIPPSSLRGYLTNFTSYVRDTTGVFLYSSFTAASTSFTTNVLYDNSSTYTFQGMTPALTSQNSPILYITFQASQYNIFF